MQAATKRHVKHGREFDKYFQPSRHRTTEVFKDADTQDTIDFIVVTVKDTTWQTKKIAVYLKGSSLDETCSNLWHFLYDYVDYQLDTAGVEEIETPNRIWENRETDCDGYATFISTVLNNLGIAHKLRVTAYGGGWQHIYVVVPKDGNLSKDLDAHSNRSEYIVIDPVTDNYNFEAPYSKKNDTPMRMTALSGLGDNLVDTEKYASFTVDQPNIVHSYLDPNTGFIFGTDGKGNVYIFLPDETDALGELGTWGIFKAAAKVVTAPIKAVVAVTKTVVDTTFDLANKIPGVYQAANKAGVIIAPVVRFAARYLDPVSITLRNGWLLCMKINLFQVAEGLRWGYADFNTASTKGGFDLASYNKIKEKVLEVENIYYKIGGEKPVLKKAILNGKGNKDGLVPKDNTATEKFNDQEELEVLAADADAVQASLKGFGGIAGLGFAPAVAIAAATAAVGAVGGVLAPIMATVQKNKEAAAQKALATAQQAQALADAEKAKAIAAAQQTALLQQQATQSAQAAQTAQVIAQTKAATAAVTKKPTTSSGVSTSTVLVIAGILGAGALAYNQSNR